MSLYLCIFDEEDELDGVSVGAYSDFRDFCDAVAKILEADKRGSRFPTLMMHSDCDGEWSAGECDKLAGELQMISEEMKSLPPKGFSAEWQKRQAGSLGLHPQNLYECFIDVDGESLLERL